MLHVTSRCLYKNATLQVMVVEAACRTQSKVAQILIQLVTHQNILLDLLNAKIYKTTLYLLEVGNQR